MAIHEILAIQHNVNSKTYVGDTHLLCWLSTLAWFHMNWYTHFQYTSKSSKDIDISPLIYIKAHHMFMYNIMWLQRVLGTANVCKLLCNNFGHAQKEVKCNSSALTSQHTSFQNGKIYVPMNLALPNQQKQHIMCTNSTIVVVAVSQYR